MPVPPFDFQRLNGTTWFIFSFLLMLAVYFRWTRFFSLRNWDILLAFLLMPGLVFITRYERSMGEVRGNAEQLAAIRFERSIGYVVLLSVTGVMVIRALVDLLLLRRPRIEPNLNTSGLIVLGCALLGFQTWEILVKDPDVATRAALRATGDRRPAGVGETAPPHGAAMQPPQAATGVFSYFVARLSDAVAGRITEGEPLKRNDLEIGAARSMSILSHLLTLGGLVFIGWRHFDGPATGIAMAVLYLLCPTTAVHVEKVDHVLPGMLLIWAIGFWRVPIVSGMLLGLSSWYIFPLLLLPLWIGFHRGRGAVRFTLSFAISALLLSLAVLVFAPEATFQMMWANAGAWRPWELQLDRIDPGIWTEYTQAFRLPIFLVYLSLVIITAFWPRNKNLAELMALSLLLVLGTQFWYGQRGGCYVSWYLPLFLVLIFRPNLAGPPGTASTQTGRLGTA